MKNTPQSVSTVNRQRQSRASLKYTKCIYQNMETGHLYLKILDNPHEKTISESSQNKEWHETIKLLTEEVTILQKKKILKSLGNKTDQCMRNFGCLHFWKIRENWKTTSKSRLPKEIPGNSWKQWIRENQWKGFLDNKKYFSADMK